MYSNVSGGLNINPNAKSIVNVMSFKVTSARSQGSSSNLNLKKIKSTGSSSSKTKISCKMTKLNKDFIQACLKSLQKTGGDCSLAPLAADYIKHTSTLLKIKSDELKIIGNSEELSTLKAIANEPFTPERSLNNLKSTTALSTISSIASPSLSHKLDLHPQANGFAHFYSSAASQLPLYNGITSEEIKSQTHLSKKLSEPFSFNLSKGIDQTGHKNGPLTSTPFVHPPQSKAVFSFFPNPVSTSISSVVAEQPAHCSQEECEDEASEKEAQAHEFKPVVEEDAKFSIKCKIFDKKDSSYNVRGVGMLYIRPLDTKHQLIVRADNSLGKVLLNFKLDPNLPLSLNKNNVVTVDPHNSPPIPILIRVKTDENAQLLMEKIKEFSLI